jgi:predicted ATP-grasp superfamily ATP-dependent carboligase
VLILGASARAAAASARRAGLEPFALDLFADVDTRQLCECVRCPPEEYPAGLFRLAKRMPPMPWLYTGGLENYPELVGELAAERALWGNGPDVLRRVRNPASLSDILWGKAFAYPRVQPPGSSPPAGQWLRKSLTGSGGFGIRRATADDLAQLADPECGFYLQEFVAGKPLSAVFISTQSRCELLGVTGQLIGTPWLHAKPFRYAGNVGPLDLDDGTRSNLTLLGYRLMMRSGLRGAWGVDLISTPDQPTTVEVNPRYPASAEVLELALRTSFIGRGHTSGAATARERPAALAGFQEPRPPGSGGGASRSLAVAAPENPRLGGRGSCVGKAIYYAPRRVTFPASGPWDDSLKHAADVWRRPDFADIPYPGTAVEPGQPVLTILTEADTEAECLARLRSRAVELDRLFGFRAPAEEEPCSP